MFKVAGRICPFAKKFKSTVLRDVDASLEGIQF